MNYNNSLRPLSIAILSLLLASCGGGGGGSTSTTPGVTPPGGTGTTPPDPFPEPTSARYDELELDGFYDIDANGQTRAVRNDLTGTLNAMVQFAQDHTVDPNGNEAKNMPRLTTERAALLMVTPDPAMADVDSIKVVVSLDGAVKQTLTLLHPNAMYRSDFNNSDGRPDYNYSRRAWSVMLPWDLVKPGMSLAISDDKGRSGSLAADKIDFGAPSELVVQSIRLGMLTDPPAENDNMWMLRQPEQAASDYFQTIPAARMTVSYYEPVKFPKVMVASGVIYDTASATTGDVYSGDMRENTGKSTVSVGINLANYGGTSSGMATQEQPQLFQHVLAHHAVGVYSNGVQSHGLSGGNGMLTVYATRYNEFSHEIGHHYGLGHYPGEKDGNYFWAGHHHDSGWGLISYRKRMRANLHWSAAKNAMPAGMPIYRDTYAFAPDAMSGGSFDSALSRYTHYTGYSTKIKIQPNLSKPVPSASSSSGYLAWNADTRKMEEFTSKVPNNPRLFFPTPDGNYLKPRLIGTPVFTILGGYNPDTGAALLYPALRGNWGNVFNLPQPAAGATARQCWLKVDFANGNSSKMEVAGKILQSGSVNKLHINLAQADKPTKATLQCQLPGEAVADLSSVDIPQGLPAMPAPVVVGKDAGYKALRAVELPELDSLLQAAGSGSYVNLGARGTLLYASWGDDATGLSSAGRDVLQRYQTQEQNATRINRWMNRYRTELQAVNNTAAVDALKKLLDKLKLRQTPLLPEAKQLLVTGGHCVKVENVSGRLNPYIAAASTCTKADDELWLSDARGAIRNVANLDMCLSAGGGNAQAVTLSKCDVNNALQSFDLSALPAVKRGGRCLDMSGGYLSNNRAPLITYNCTGGANQKWSGVTANDNPLLPVLTNKNLAVLIGLHIN